MALHENLDRSSCGKRSVALQKRIMMSAAPWGASGDIEGTRAAESDFDSARICRARKWRPTISMQHPPEGKLLRGIPTLGHRESLCLGTAEASPLRSIGSKKSGRLLCRSLFRSREKNHFRLVNAVRSAESLTIPVAPHQLEPAPPGLIGVTLAVPEALKALVNALQSPFDKLVSE